MWRHLMRIPPTIKQLIITIYAPHLLLVACFVFTISLSLSLSLSLSVSFSVSFFFVFSLSLSLSHTHTQCELIGFYDESVWSNVAEIWTQGLHSSVIFFSVSVRPCLSLSPARDCNIFRETSISASCV